MPGFELGIKVSTPRRAEPGRVPGRDEGLQSHAPAPYSAEIILTSDLHDPADACLAREQWPSLIADMQHVH
jgi:hypothetical protein